MWAGHAVGSQPLEVGTMGQGIQDGVVSLPLTTRQALGRAWAILDALAQYVFTAGMCCYVILCNDMALWCVSCVLVFLGSRYSHLGYPPVLWCVVCVGIVPMW